MGAVQDLQKDNVTLCLVLSIDWESGTHNENV